MNSTVLRRFTYGDGRGRTFLPGDPFELTGARAEKALLSRAYVREGYDPPPPAPEPTLSELVFGIWTDELIPSGSLSGAGGQPEESRPHNRKRKVSNAGN